MGIYCENSIKNTITTNKEIIERIYKRTLELKPKKEIMYTPFTENDDDNINAYFSIDLKKYHPSAKEGDYAYIEAYYDGLYKENLIIVIFENNNATAFFNNKKITDLSLNNDGNCEAQVEFNEGRNSLIIKVPCNEESFRVGVSVYIPGLRSKPVCYGYCTWQYNLMEGFRYQMMPQISRLYNENESISDVSKIDWVYPKMPRQPESFSFDFNKRCKRGNASYGYTYALGNVKINHNSPIKVFEDGIVVYSEKEGCFEKYYSSPTPVLVKSVKANGEWGFSASSDREFSLPFVKGADCPDLSWMWVGPFGREDESVDYPYPPEKNLTFKEPYASVCEGQIYWNFYRENTYLRQFLHSNFFGQWFYAMMVSQYGLLQASKILGDNSYSEYFSESTKLMCDHRRYSTYDIKKSGYPSYLYHAAKEFDRLDPIGTIGVNVAEYYLMTGDIKAEQTLEKLASSLNNVPRFPDGTLYRIDTMWTDDTYMSLPFLARLGVIFNDNKYFDDILTQVRGYEERLFMEDQNIFSHIFFPDENKANRVPWGRGNGWVLLALSEVLLLMPKDYEGRDEILTLFRKFTDGILSFRDKKYGFWHQVINNPDSYMESSGSAMFIIALARGVREGWIDAYIKDIVIDAWDNLVKECIDTDGNVYGVCMGSSCSMEEKYYLDLGTVINDDHGVGIILTAGAEVMKIEG